MIRLVIADDQAVVRAGLSVILGAEEDIEVVGEAADGAEAIALARELRPDVVCMDIRMPGTDGIAATRAIVSDPDLDVDVLILTTFDVDDDVLASLEAGAAGFLLKGADEDTLLGAVRSVAAGKEPWTSASPAGSCVSSPGEAPEVRSSDMAPGLSISTPTELRMLAVHPGMRRTPEPLPWTSP